MLDLFRTLPGIMGDIEGAEMVREAVVFAAWRKIAGDALANHAVPVRLERATLWIAVSNITWQRHLKDLCGQMVFKLNAALAAPLVTRIELQIDEAIVLQARLSHLKPAEADNQFRKEAENELSPELMAAAGAIEDSELRKQFLLAAGNCLVRRKRIAQRTTPSAGTTPPTKRRHPSSNQEGS
jgi:hypothetical protein